MIESFRDLKVYQRSYSLVLEIYELVRKFPNDERFGLTSQLKRAAFSIPLCIAEGYGKRESVKEFKRFLQMAQGSRDEVDVLLDLVKDLRFIEESEYSHLKSGYEEVGRMLHGMVVNWR